MKEQVLTAILKGIDEGIHAVDINGITIFYNEVAALHDGMGMDEVLGKPLLESFPSLSLKSSTLLQVMKTKQPIYDQSQSYINLHGKRIETLNTTLPIFVEGELVGAVEIAKDYSRLKILSERLLDLQKASVPSEKNLRPAGSTVYTLDDLLTGNGLFKELKMEALKLAASSSPILVFGESGCGKELFVQGIHHASARREKPFIAQNCAAIPETLLEGILFGTAKGSYTGAVERPGLFELADGGTLFLDELHTMPALLQAKLLRVLEDGAVRRVGGSRNIATDVRIIAAMNIHPHEAMEQGILRHDLYYRLNVFTFELIPLRKRPEDIGLLASHFLNSFNRKLGKNVKVIGSTAAKFFSSYHWPGNVRELKHTIEYMVNVSKGSELTEEDLPAMLKQMRSKSGSRTVALSLKERVQAAEKEIIEAAIAGTGGNILQAARLLNIPRQTLQYKLHKHQLGNAE
ncbi:MULTISPECIES: sigma-54 interaction domain-containing protein [Bacillaceae]|uniref:sigma-54 interaction domain-containing protein n=1 Tax=Bacillaceae TaxID=186817 RepID=UPI00296542EC|nr:sigma 54-interacting transcriptional regulator [Bacillus infantis]MDW2875245.1 sigma 54-interacting transcriptional regulator [Bacillus infantis]